MLGLVGLFMDFSDFGFFCFCYEDLWEDEDFIGLFEFFFLDGFFSSRVFGIDFWVFSFSLWVLEFSREVSVEKLFFYCFEDDWFEFIFELYMVLVVW